MKTYSAKVVQIVESGDAILQFSKNMIQDLDWKAGDKLKIYIEEDDDIILENITALIRNRK